MKRFMKKEEEEKQLYLRLKEKWESRMEEDDG